MVMDRIFSLIPAWASTVIAYFGARIPTVAAALKLKA